MVAGEKHVGGGGAGQRKDQVSIDDDEGQGRRRGNTAPAGPRAPAAGLRATRYIRLLEQAWATRASLDY